MRFTAGWKRYQCHRIVCECYNGFIEDGFVIDHINGIKNDNFLSIESITLSGNTQRGKTRKYQKNAKYAASKDIHTGEERVFQSMNAAGKYFDICMPSVRYVAEGIHKSAISKETGHIIKVLKIATQFY